MRPPSTRRAARVNNTPTAARRAAPPSSTPAAIRIRRYRRNLRPQVAFVAGPGHHRILTIRRTSPRSSLIGLTRLTFVLPVASCMA
jgi:hypothetical protein